MTVWNSFYWAFITTSTVGYGERTLATGMLSIQGQHLPAEMKAAL